MLGEFLGSDVEGVEGIGAVGAVFEEVFLGLRGFLHGLVFSEAVAASFYASRLNGENEVVIVLAVEERHQPLLPGKTLVDEEIFLIVPHRVAEVNVVDLTPVAFELVNDDIAEVLVIHCIVRTESGRVIIVDDRLVLVCR